MPHISFLPAPPRQYAEAMRLDQFKTGVKKGATVTVTGAMYEAGYGPRVRIGYTIADCTLGRLLVAATEKGVCAVRLGDSDQALTADLLSEFPAADVTRDETTLAKWVEQLVDHLAGKRPHLDLPLDVQATAFQRTVWETLGEIPYGSTRSYSDIARAIGRPTATRAVARACATNPVALVIPCHRVVREDKSLGGYRWGLARKKALLAREATD